MSDQRWQERGACWETNSNLFFQESGSGSGQYYQTAVQTCQQCPVTEECYQFALKNELYWGVWGGRVLEWFPISTLPKLRPVWDHKFKCEFCHHQVGWEQVQTVSYRKVNYCPTCYETVRERQATQKYREVPEGKVWCRWCDRVLDENQTQNRPNSPYKACFDCMKCVRREIRSWQKHKGNSRGATEAALVLCAEHRWQDNYHQPPPPKTEQGKCPWCDRPGQPLRAVSMIDGKRLCADCAQCLYRESNQNYKENGNTRGSIKNARRLCVEHRWDHNRTLKSRD